jgi:MFS family permease
MSAPATLPLPPAVRPFVGWRWVHVGVAALAMVATLPGRTHGLGLFTEPILTTFELGRDAYGALNLWATLLGGLFCLPCGWLMDRLGVRAVLVSVMALLALSVGGLALWTEGVVGLFVFVLLTRGLGQSALSVASLTLIGRSAGIRNGLAMGVYSLLTTVGFVGAFGVLRGVVTADPNDWRTPWAGIGVGVLGAAVLSLLLVRDRVAGVKEAVAAEPSRTLGEALRSPAFWAFALGTSFYGLVASGTSLFNESILAERGFAKEVFLNVTIVGIPVGLVANLLGGWLATKLPLGKLFAGSLLLLAGTLAVFPVITAEWQVYAYASALAAAGGVITVCFFTVWRRVYGPAALGRIQGAAQLLTVLFSAVGPLLLGVAKTSLGQYAPLFPAFALSAAVLAGFAWVVRVTPPGADR